MERPTGPLGAATQSTARPMVDNGIPKQATLPYMRRMPPTVRPVASNSSLSTQPSSLSPSQVVALAREAMKNALEENQSKAADTSGVSNELKPGVTIDLSHKNIQRFPEEVVDIIKNELERLALSHNQISVFPSSFSECASLRYLNVRNNFIREFPQPICQLVSLEILDLGRNKLKFLPTELVKLVSLKVLSVQKNRIESLPLCLADMASLKVLKLDGNPIRFPPKEILQPQATSPPNGALLENEIDDVAITSQIKRFLKQKQISDRSETESCEEESSEGGTETPRPTKRVTSGRFPIKVNGTDVPDLRSPALQRAPPIPSRSHYRGLSQQNAALRRPGVMPLTIGSANERVRSNSEGLAQATRDQRPGSSSSSRRMGIISKKASDLDTVDESKSNRLSHYRGLSHGSAMQTGSTNGAVSSKSPASPADSLIQRATYVRRLSSLPERKRKSVSPDPDVEAAKSILYALFQVHPLIQNLLGVTRDATSKRTSLERVFYNATTHVEELDKTIQDYMSPIEEDEEEAVPRSGENVRHACVTCVHAYVHVLNLLQRNVDTLIENGDPRYLRTLLLLLYGSTCEIYTAHTSFLQGAQNRKRPQLTVVHETDGEASPLRDKCITPTRERPGTAMRLRSATVVQHSPNLRVATDTRLPPFLNAGGRSATFSSATPRSGESFSSSNTSGGLSRAGEFTDEDRLFEKIFLRLQQSSEMIIRTIPSVHNHFFVAMRASSQQSNPEQPKHFWQVLIQKCLMASQTAEALKSRLSLIKFKEPGIRTQGAFWQLCYGFIQAFTELVIKVKEAKSMTKFLNNDIIVLLRPLQKAIKDTSQLIQSSPWSFLASQSVSEGVNGSYTTQPVLQVPLPMTPQSVALGPAVQATVPSTPQSGSYNAMFNGNVFERADALLSMNSSVASSRTTTMTSSTGSLLSNDGTMTSTSMISSMNSIGGKYSGIGKVTF